MKNKLKKKVEFVKYMLGDDNKRFGEFIRGLESDIALGKEIKFDKVNRGLDIIILEGFMYDGSIFFAHVTKQQIEDILELFPVKEFQRKLLLKRKNIFDNIDIIKNIKGDE